MPNRASAKDEIVSLSPDETGRTMADGLRVPQLGRLPFANIRAYVRDIVSVTEDDIRRAMQAIAAEARLMAEPSGAVALAGAHGAKISAREDRCPSSRAAMSNRRSTRRCSASETASELLAELDADEARPLRHVIGLRVADLRSRIRRSGILRTVVERVLHEYFRRPCIAFHSGGEIELGIAGLLAEHGADRNQADGPKGG